jgi:PPE-repeat protein
MSDFGTLPPEVISGLIYTGPGPGALQTAAAAWHDLSIELQQTAVSYRNVLNGVTEVWQGASAQEMVASVQPFLMWMENTAAGAMVTAQAAMGAVAAYSEVRGTVVPPPLIVSNRTQLLHLISTNILGQNTAAIAATEAQYEAMWAQDTAAMNTYDTSSQSATDALQPFQPAPQVATPLTSQTVAAVPAQTTLLEFIQALIPGFTVGDPLGNLAALITSPLGIAVVSSGEFAVDPLGLVGAFLGLVGIGSAAVAQEVANTAMGTVANALRPPSVSVNSPPVAPEVKAQVGAAHRLGRMCVPPSWAQPEQSKAVEPLPYTPEGDSDNKVPIGLPVIPAVPVTGGKAGKKKGTQFEDMDYGEPVPPILNRHPSGG